MTDEPKISVTEAELIQIFRHVCEPAPTTHDELKIKGLFALLSRTYAAPVKRGRKPKAVGA